MRPPLQGFPPVAAPEARVLVLGSMPGVASLRKGEYYGHPRNAFWPIMGALFGAGPELDYGARCARLAAAGVALWDVLAACRRVGSLDSAIEAHSEAANDFAAFLDAHPRLDAVVFNGAKAEQAWRRHVAPALAGRDTALAGRGTALDFRRLPSTSPAHAALDFDAKCRAWAVVRDLATAQRRATR